MVTLNSKFAATLISASLLASGVAVASPLADAVALAEQQFAGEAFEAELYREDGRRIVEVEVLSGNLIVEAVYNANTGALIDSDTYGSQRRVNRIRRALNRAEISLIDAIEIAAARLRPGRATEAELDIRRNPRRNGRRFEVEYISQGEEFDVYINSRSGRVVKIEEDD